LKEGINAYYPNNWKKDHQTEIDGYINVDLKYASMRLNLIEFLKENSEDKDF